MRLSHADPRKMTLSRLNMHYDEPEPDICDIIGSVRKHGVLETLLVRETLQDGAVVPEHFEVVAGRRRWVAALAAGAEGIEIDPVPIGILEPGDDAAALEISLIENMGRLPPGEVACWETFVRLIRQGRTPEQLAATFGKTEAVIHRILALGNLLPRIRKLYRREEIDVATVRQLTLASKGQQKDWLKLYDDPAQREPRGAQLKAWLFGGEAIPTRLAIFALDDYPGAIIADLFGEEAYFTDAALFWTHQNSAVAAKAQALRAEGWAEVEVLEVGQTFYSYHYVKTPKAKGGKVIIGVSRRGEVTINEGWLTAKEARRAEAAARKAVVGADGKSEPDLGGKAERSEVTAAQQAYIDLHRRAAVRAVLTDHLDVALRLLVAHAVAGSRYWRLEADPLGAGSQAAADSLAVSPGETIFAARQSEAIGLLGLVAGGALVERDYTGGAAAVFARLLCLTDAQVLAVAAVVLGETLAAGGAEVEAAGTYLQVDMGEFWSPDEAFFDGIKDRETINAMLKEVGGRRVADGNVSEKVRTQKTILRDLLAGTNDRPKVERWTPRWLTFPAQAYTRRPFATAARSKVVAPLLRRVRPPVEGPSTPGAVPAEPEPTCGAEAVAAQ
ncbi:ParB/RepB/Spo0J family partition protein [Caulobacter sp. LARHSG274]